MTEQFERTERLLGGAAMEKLAAARVAVFGLGGVGGHAAEALARCGVGHLDLIDRDTVAESNLNRQAVALHSTLGQKKTDALAARLRDISPALVIVKWDCFFLPETADAFDFSVYDYVVDAIDTLAGKLEIIRRAKAAGVPVISAMGAGNKLDPTRFRVTDIEKTSVCPLARTVRLALRREGIRGVKAVWSDEVPRTPAPPPEGSLPSGKYTSPGSVSFVPPVAGMILAGEVIRDLAGISLKAGG